jgi:hypothetical protein
LEPIPDPANYADYSTTRKTSILQKIQELQEIDNKVVDLTSRMAKTQANTPEYRALQQERQPLFIKASRARDFIKDQELDEEEERERAANGGGDDKEEEEEEEEEEVGSGSGSGSEEEEESSGEFSADLQKTMDEEEIKNAAKKANLKTPASAARMPFRSTPTPSTANKLSPQQMHALNPGLSSNLKLMATTPASRTSAHIPITPIVSALPATPLSRKKKTTITEETQPTRKSTRVTNPPVHYPKEPGRKK